MENLHDASGRFTKKYTDSQILKIQQLHTQGLKLQQIAVKTGLSISQVRYLVYLKKPVKTTTTASTPKITKLADGSISSVGFRACRDGEKQDENAILLAHGMDPQQFLLTSVVDNFWGKDDEGQPLYQTKIKAVPKEIDVKSLVDSINKQITPLKPVKTKLRTGKNTLIVPLFDLHFGISSYDTMKPFLDQIIATIEQGFKTVLIILGGDYFHSNSITRSITVKGTQLDHVNMEQALDDCDRFFTELMSASLSYAAHTIVISVPGNHDMDLSYVWARAMKQRYSKAADTFEVTADTWAAFNVDQCGFMIAHGDIAKDRLFNLFTGEAKDIWYKTNFHGIFYGHFHKEIVTDDKYALVFQVGTPKPADAWEKRHGLVMSTRKMELFEFDKSHLVSTYYIYPDYKKEN